MNPNFWPEPVELHKSIAQSMFLYGVKMYENLCGSDYLPGGNSLKAIMFTHWKYSEYATDR